MSLNPSFKIPSKYLKRLPEEFFYESRHHGVYLYEYARFKILDKNFKNSQKPNYYVQEAWTESYANGHRLYYWRNAPQRINLKIKYKEDIEIVDYPFYYKGRLYYIRKPEELVVFKIRRRDITNNWRIFNYYAYYGGDKRLRFISLETYRKYLRLYREKKRLKEDFLKNEQKGHL